MAYSSHPSGISQTCPDIDKVIKSINEALKLSREAEGYENIEDVQNNLHWINMELCDLEWKLEDLRTANSKLREWGESESERADKAEGELYELESKQQI